MVLIGTNVAAPGHFWCIMSCLLRPEARICSQMLGKRLIGVYMLSWDVNASFCVGVGGTLVLMLQPFAERQ